LDFFDFYFCHLAIGENKKKRKYPFGNQETPTLKKVKLTKNGKFFFLNQFFNFSRQQNRILEKYFPTYQNLWQKNF